MSSSAQALDLAAPENLARTWVARVSQCEVKTEGGALVCNVTGSSDRSGGQYGGLRLKIGAVKAVQVDVTFTNPENIVGVFADLTVGTSREPRLRWELLAKGGVQVPAGQQTLTFRPGMNTGYFRYTGGTASLDKVNYLQFFIRVKPNSTAGFRISKIAVER